MWLYMVNGREYSDGVYGHLSTTERNRLQEVYSPPHNNSAIIDTVYLPRIFTYSSSPNINASIVNRGYYMAAWRYEISLRVLKYFFNTRAAM